MTRAGITTEWPGGTRPDLSDIDGFWTAPIAERAAAFAALRWHEPVSFHAEPVIAMLPPGPGFWALTRFDDVVEASRTPAVFTSGSGATSIPDSPPEFREFFGSMIELDDPRHARLRGIVSRKFTPKQLQKVLDDVVTTADEVIDGISEQGEVDLVETVSQPFPLLIICDMMAVSYTHLTLPTTERV